MSTGPAYGRNDANNALGESDSAYREQLYAHGLTEATRPVAAGTLQDLVTRAAKCTERCIRTNRREDGLYHAYNINSSDFVLDRLRFTREQSRSTHAR